MGKTVVVIGGGGRESVLVKKYSESPHVSKLIAIPGNDLMQILSKKEIVLFPKIKTTDIQKIISICKKEKADLIDIPQDDAVEAGLVDELEKNGFKVFGPTKKAGQIEWDKAWSRNFMKKYRLPIPVYEVFDNQNKAIKFVKKNPSKKWFVKASGLAAGKGAIPAENTNDAIIAIRQMKKFGVAGKNFVIEEWLEGEEFSFFAISDGKYYQILGSAQDHKRLYNGDRGPNTGGVGAVSNPIVVNKTIYKQAERIIEKTLNGLNKEKRPYKVVLYLGAIVVNKKVYIIEFNARWGDPEAQILVPSIENDLYRIGVAVSEGKLKNIKIKTDRACRIVVTGSLREGLVKKERELFGPKEVINMDGISFYSTRVYRKNKRYFVTSGRLFHLVAEGENIIEARMKVYSAMSQLFIEGNALYYRTDIGWRDVARFHKTS